MKNKFIFLLVFNFSFMTFCAHQFNVINLNAQASTEAFQENIEDVKIQEVKLRGSGCKTYNTSTVTSSDNTLLSVIFDEFKMSFPPPINSPTGPKIFQDCDIKLKLVTKKNIKITNLEIFYDLRGFIYLQPDIYTSLVARALSVSKKLTNGTSTTVYSQTGNLFVANWGKKNEDVSESWTLTKSANIADPFQCAQTDDDMWEIIVKNNAMMIGNGKAITNRHQGEFYVDSADSFSQVKFKVKYETCK